jgi:hypothetical protein
VVACGIGVCGVVGVGTAGVETTAGIFEAALVQGSTGPATSAVGAGTVVGVVAGASAGAAGVEGCTRSGHAVAA